MLATKHTHFTLVFYLTDVYFMYYCHCREEDQIMLLFFSSFGCFVNLVLKRPHVETRESHKEWKTGLCFIQTVYCRWNNFHPIKMSYSGFMYLVISLLVLRAGYGIWLYQFLIIAYLFTLYILSSLEWSNWSQRIRIYNLLYDELRVDFSGDQWHLTPILEKTVSTNCSPPPCSNQYSRNNQDPVTDLDSNQVLPLYHEWWPVIIKLPVIITF